MTSVRLIAVLAFFLALALSGVQPVRAESPSPSDHAAEAARLEERLARELAELEELKKTYAGLREREADLLEKLGLDHEDLSRLENIFREEAAESLSLLENSLIAPRNPSSLEPLRAWPQKNLFPGLTEIEFLADLLFQEMEVSGRIELFTGTFIDRDGIESSGQILRAGGLSAFYQNGDDFGFLHPLDGGRSYLAMPARPTRRQSRDIAAFMAGSGAALPLDLSSGAVFAHLDAGVSWRERLAAGGVLVWPIIGTALAALILILERLFVLGRLKGNSDAVFSRVKELASTGDWPACRDLCRDRRTPACRVILAGLEQNGRSFEMIDHAVQEAILGQLPKLERFLPTLGVLAAIAPLLGLLGTVTGMIETFRIITIFGSGDPRLMAGGISEALITTQLGLAVAMPIIVIHHFLERRVDAIADDMEEKGLALMGTLNGGAKVA